MRDRSFPAILAACLLLGGCTMSGEWWVRHSLREAGFSRPEAACAARGVREHLSQEQMWEIRTALSDLDRPDASAGAEALLAWSEARLDPDIHRILAHFAAHCRRG